jgi:hypothetical protein
METNRIEYKRELSEGLEKEMVVFPISEENGIELLNQLTDINIDAVL